MECYPCGSSRLVRGYANARYESLARLVIHHLRRLPANGRFSPAHRTAWDEFCHDQQFGPHPDIEHDARFASVMFGRIGDYCFGMPKEEAALLTATAFWELGRVPYGWAAGEVSEQDIRDHLEKVIRKMAMDRDLAPFDPDYLRVRARRRRLQKRGGPRLVKWTPKGSRLGLGTVTVRSDRPLDRLDYEGALAERIDALIAAEDPEDALALLQAVEDIEHFAFQLHRLHEVGSILVEYSEWLLQRRGRPRTWPIPTSVLARARKAPAEPTEETLEEFLGMLYG